MAKSSDSILIYIRTVYIGRTSGRKEVLVCWGFSIDSVKYYMEEEKGYKPTQYSISDLNVTKAAGFIVELDKLPEV